MAFSGLSRQWSGYFLLLKYIYIDRACVLGMVEYPGQDDLIGIQELPRQLVHDIGTDFINRNDVL